MLYSSRVKAYNLRKGGVCLAKNNNKQSANWMSEGLTIAAVPAAGYLIASAYEFGFASKLGIPLQLISIDLTKVLLIGGILIIASLFYLEIYDAIWKSRLKSGGQNKHAKRKELKSSLRHIEGAFGDWAASVYILFIALVMISFTWGSSEAKYRKNFFVIGNSPETVVLRIYGDKLICAPFDRTDKIVEGNIVIRKMFGSSSLMLRSEEIGPLRLRKKSWKSL